MRLDEWRAMVNVELDALDAWWKSEFANLPRYGDMMRVSDADCLRQEYARRLEAIVERLIAMVERDDPEFAREQRESLARAVADLHRPSTPEGWLH